MNLTDLKQKPISELQEIADEMGLEGVARRSFRIAARFGNPFGQSIGQSLALEERRAGQ